MKKDVKSETKKMSDREKKVLDYKTGAKEEDIYDDDALDDMEENDEISPKEEGFMRGELHGGQKAKCDTCGKVLSEDSCVEREIKEALYTFCNELCAKKFQMNKNKKKDL